MDRRVISRDRYEVSDDDLNNSQIWAQDGTGRVVRETLRCGGMTSSSPQTAIA